MDVKWDRAGNMDIGRLMGELVSNESEVVTGTNSWMILD